MYELRSKDFAYSALAKCSVNGSTLQGLAATIQSGASLDVPWVALVGASAKSTDFTAKVTGTVRAKDTCTRHAQTRSVCASALLECLLSFGTWQQS